MTSFLVRLSRALAALGLTSRIPVTAKEVFQFREVYIARRNLIAWSFCNASNPLELVDIVLTEDLSNMQVQMKRVEGYAVPVLSKSDLIAMKRRSGRPQDLADVEALERL